MNLFCTLLAILLSPASATVQAGRDTNHKEPAKGLEEKRDGRSGRFQNSSGDNRGNQHESSNRGFGEKDGRDFQRPGNDRDFNPHQLNRHFPEPRGRFQDRRWMGRPKFFRQRFRDGSFRSLGRASFYRDWASRRGSCGYIPEVNNVVALPRQYMPAACGSCVWVRHGNMVNKAVVTDTCFDCSPNDIRLGHIFYSRFRRLLERDFDADWDFTEC